MAHLARRLSGGGAVFHDLGKMIRYLNPSKAKLQCAKIYSDSMDWSFIPELEKKLEGCRFERQALYARLSGSGIYAADDVYQL